MDISRDIANYLDDDDDIRKQSRTTFESFHCANGRVSIAQCVDSDGKKYQFNTCFVSSWCVRTEEIQNSRLSLASGRLSAIIES